MDGNIYLPTAAGLLGPRPEASELCFDSWREAASRCSPVARPATCTRLSIVRYSGPGLATPAGELLALYVLLC